MSKVRKTARSGKQPSAKNTLVTRYGRGQGDVWEAGRGDSGHVWSGTGSPLPRRTF